MEKSTQKIDVVHLPQPGRQLIIEPLDYSNPYDHTRLHRHDYFEIIMVKNGEGSQLIDFTDYPMNEGNIFVIYPGQVHLMNRCSTQGMVLQFRKNIFDHLHPLKHHHFFHKSPGINCNVDTFNHLYDVASRIESTINNTETGMLTHYKAYSYLQIILISLLDAQQQVTDYNKESLVATQFISLITDHIRVKKKVSEYAELMACNTDKLNEACKKAMGRTALEIIHEELMLEIRRLLLLNELSLKEVAFELNFDTQGNFNAFVKAKTGLTPKELQQRVLEIYNK